MEISEKELIKAIPSYLKILEKDSTPYPSVICTMGVDIINYQAQIKLTSLRNRNLSFTFDIPEDRKEEFMIVWKRIQKENENI